MERLRRWMAARDAPTRRRVAFASLIVVVFAIYLLATTARDEDATFWLEGGRALGASEARAVTQVLAERGIGVVSGPRGQLGVSQRQASEAIKLLDQQGLARRSFEQLIEESPRASIFADPSDREQMRRRTRERRIEAKLEEFEGVLSATVLLHEGRAVRLQARVDARATVFITPREAGPISTDLLERIETTLVAMEPNLARGRDVTIIDQAGRSYLEAGDPTVALRTRADARAHAWEAAISRRLGPFIPGVRVSVRLDWSTPEPRAGASERSAAVAVPNAPVALDQGGAESVEAPPEPIARANVLVEVPSQYFLDRFESMVGVDRIPTQAELKPLLEQTTDLIEKSVEYEIPRETPRDCQIVKLPLPILPRAASAAGARAHRDLRPWWAGAAIAGCVVLGLAFTAGGRRLALARRTPAEPAEGARFDSEDREGPADRVRELVRRDPETAASVLRRWVGEGGNLA